MPQPPVLKDAWEELWGRLIAWNISASDPIRYAIERLQASPIRSEDVWTLIELLALFINAERRKAQQVAAEVATTATTAAAEIQQRLAALPQPNEV